MRTSISKSVSILGCCYDWLRLLSKYLAVNPNEMDWHCGEQSFEKNSERMQHPIYLKCRSAMDVHKNALLKGGRELYVCYLSSTIYVVDSMGNNKLTLGGASK